MVYYTRIANAFKHPHHHHIQVTITVYQLTTQEFNKANGYSASGNVGLTGNIPSMGFNASGDYKNEEKGVRAFESSTFNITSMNSHSWRNNGNEEYMTIFARDANDKTISLICQNYRISADSSYIVDHDGNIRLQKYGQSHFTDEFGNNWRR